MNPTAPTPAAAPVIVAVETLPAITHTEARWYRRAERRARVIWIVLHCTDGVEGFRKAADCAHMLATIPTRELGGKPRSAHLVLDTSAIVQCVPFEREAYHCGRNGNTYGEGIELCGRAAQTRAEWLDTASLPMLAIAARLIRWRAAELGIPLVHVDAPGLLVRKPGITTHADITRAFPADTTHSDPGPHFPLDELLAAARVAP